jgi:hypothetical protein
MHYWTEKKCVENSEVVISIAIVAPHRIRVVRSFNKLGCMPLCTVIVSTTTPRAIAPRNKLSHMFVTAATRPPHGPNIVAVKHVLHCINAKKTIVVWGVVAMEVVICILDI